jgi:hypothetical protein
MPHARLRVVGAEQPGVQARQARPLRAQAGRQRRAGQRAPLRRAKERGVAVGRRTAAEARQRRARGRRERCHVGRPRRARVTKLRQQAQREQCGGAAAGRHQRGGCRVGGGVAGAQRKHVAQRRGRQRRAGALQRRQPPRGAAHGERQAPGQAQQHGARLARVHARQPAAAVRIRAHRHRGRRQARLGAVARQPAQQARVAGVISAVCHRASCAAPPARGHLLLRVACARERTGGAHG